MAQFSVITHRLDPYKNFKFRVKWDGKYVAGVSKTSPLKRSTVPVAHRDGRVGDKGEAVRAEACQGSYTCLVEARAWNVSDSLQGGRG